MTIDVQSWPGQGGRVGNLLNTLLPELLSDRSVRNYWAVCSRLVGVVIFCWLFRSRNKLFINVASEGDNYYHESQDELVTSAGTGGAHHPPPPSHLSTFSSISQLSALSSSSQLQHKHKLFIAVRFGTGASSDIHSPYHTRYH